MKPFPPGRVVKGLRVAGVSFTDVPRGRIKDATEGAGGWFWAQLLRNPDNEHDPNAVQVIWDGVFIGHVPAWAAARIAPEIDGEGVHWVGRCRFIVHPDYPDNPGIELALARERDLDYPVPFEQTPDHN